MNIEDNEKIARLTTGAVNHPTDASIERILDLATQCEMAAVTVRERAEQTIRDFRKDVGSLSDQVAAHFEKCQQVIRALDQLHVQLFGPEEKQPSLRDTVNSMGTAAVSDAINPHPRIVESYDPDKYER